MVRDAEEYGLIGSIEYIETNLVQLDRHMIVYLNLDIAVQGGDYIAVEAYVYTLIYLDRSYCTCTRTRKPPRTQKNYAH